MALRTTAVIGFIAASFVASNIAQAQIYPPYYRAAPPAYGAPPAEWDIDDMPVGTVPGDVDRPIAPAPRANAAPDYRQPYPATQPYPGTQPYAGNQPYPGTQPYPPSSVQRDPYGLPPPGVQPYPGTPGYPPASAPGQAAVPVQPDPGYAPTARPPGAVGGDPQTGALPPDIRPETGEQKELPQRLRRQIVAYQTREPAGTIIIDTPNTYLYLVLGNGQALRYGVGVGREGFTWAGTQRIARMAEWPDWHPPPEMIERQPYLPRFMAGGPGNPLGARALYLGNTVYRIHGTNQPSTIGTFVSSGCIRLVNDDVEDLYGRVQVGTRVVVLPKSDTTAAAPPPYQQH
jgi:lipoprotein-anchoring transpeptidase ErfK/SrfK